MEGRQRKFNNDAHALALRCGQVALSNLVLRNTDERILPVDV